MLFCVGNNKLGLIIMVIIFLYNFTPSGFMFLTS